MDVSIAGTSQEIYRFGKSRVPVEFSQRLKILESFAYIQDWMIPYIRDHWQFMLDSGAFTFMGEKKAQRGSGIDWESYVDRYAEFINEHRIERFFELDIDNVVGLQRVERLRQRLESKCTRQCIPVWHKSRGLDYWKAMCADYPYVAIGGIVSGEIRRNQFSAFPALLRMAKERGAKVHGLGFTDFDGMRKYRFDSVDSTAWVYGNLGGYVYTYSNGKMRKKYGGDGQRLSTNEAAAHNFLEWVKFQRYAERNL